MTVVVLDGAGGDDAPGSTVEGAVIAARTGVEVTLTRRCSTASWRVWGERRPG